MPQPHATDLADLLESAPVPLLHVAADGTVERSNAAARQLCGAGAAPGQGVAGLWPAGSRHHGLCGPTPIQLELALNTTPAHWVSVSSQPLPQGGWMLAMQQPKSATFDAESQLALAVDLGNIAVWRHDLATQRVHYNLQAYQVLDIAPRAEGLSIDEVRALIHPDDLPQVLASATAALGQDGPADMEARYRRPDGSWRHVMTRRVVQRAADGTPLAFLGVALDISARYEHQRRADEMTRRLELATRTAGIGYWVLERGAERATWNDALRSLFQLPPGAPVPTLNEWVLGCVHPDDRAVVRRRFIQWVRSGRESVAVPMRALRPDGSVLHLLTHSRVELGPSGPLHFGLVIDLTERRSAEQARRSAEERVALSARGAGLGTWEVDLQTDEMIWDDQMFILRGHTARTMSLSEDERMACVHPDDRARMRQLLGPAIATGQALDHEFRVVRPDGQVRWLASRSVEIRDPDTGARRRIGVNWDTTDTRTAEATRREREMAQRESLAKSQFLARMSHELRTPLNAVLGFSQLLLTEEAGTDPLATTRRRRLEHIRSAGQHLLTLINDVLDLSSLEGGEMRIAMQPVALAPLVEQTLPLLGTLRDGHRVGVHVGPLQGIVLADATRLRQVLLNLLTNAIKYNREGGQVTVEALLRGPEVLLRVSDTGRGMSDEQMRHLFEPFNRLGRHLEGPGAVEGSGIGLAIVKALVERMGGSVHVDSTPGVGSVFEVRLIGTSQHALAASEPAAEQPGPRQGPSETIQRLRGRLLYVEDNPVNAMIISELISRRADLQLHVAVDGESGVRHAVETQPDLVLLDMQLPDIDGHEVLRRLRAHARTAHVPVIALSANAMPDDIERALRAGMSDYWTKPLDFATFMASIETLFGPPPERS